MKKKFINSIAACLMALSGAIGSAAAQDADTSEPVLTVPERWEAEPETVFDASEIDLSELQFIARPLVVFADSPADPNFAQQMDLILARMEGLVERDVIVIADTDPAANSDPRQTLRPRGFAIVLIGKDGRVAQRKPTPLDVRDLERSIDKMPLRQQELRERPD